MASMKESSSTNWVYMRPVIDSVSSKHNYKVLCFSSPFLCNMPGNTLYAMVAEEAVHFN